jgi:hypothetical protein
MVETYRGAQAASLGECIVCFSKNIFFHKKKFFFQLFFPKNKLSFPENGFLRQRDEKYIKIQNFNFSKMNKIFSNKCFCGFKYLDNKVLCSNLVKKKRKHKVF